jgi:ribA/ribD-fused uncharacterized protein
MKKWNQSSSVVFHRIRDEYGYLSNMTNKYPITYQGFKFHSAEHLYQSFKFNNKSIIEHINSNTNPLVAKHIAYEYPNAMFDNWNEISIKRMFLTLVLKSLQHPDLYNKLLEFNKPIIELSYKDSFWGAIPSKDNNNILIGYNKLGLCWSAIKNINLNSYVIQSHFKFLPKHHNLIL